MLNQVEQELIAHQKDSVALDLTLPSLYAILSLIQFGVIESDNCTEHLATYGRELLELICIEIAPTYPAIAKSIQDGWLSNAIVTDKELEAMTQSSFHAQLN